MAASFTVHATEMQTGTEAMRYFSENYLEARQMFLNVALDNGAVLEYFQNPHTGPQNEELFTDVVVPPVSIATCMGPPDFHKHGTTLEVT